MYTFKNLKKIFINLFLFSFFTSPSFSQNLSTQISILQIIEHPALNATRQGFLEELQKLGY